MINNQLNALDQYHAVRHGGAGLIDLSKRGRISVSGSEAVMFLNGLITNDMKTLEVNQWMPAAFPNVQGRLIAAVRVTRLTDSNENKPSPRFLLDTEGATHTRVLKTIERFTMAGDFRVADITDQTAMFSIQGTEAISIATKTIGNAVNEIERNGIAELNWHEGKVIVIRASHTGEDGLDLIVESEHAKISFDELIVGGALAIDEETFETLRIEAGIGRFGVDMDESNVISETNLDEAVSFTKGCYIGQEIIARIKYRGHVAKKLTGLTFEENDAAAVGDPIKSLDGKDIGRVTSLTFSPALNRTIALGYVRYEYLGEGTEVRVGQRELKAKVAQLPFVP